MKISACDYHIPLLKGREHPTFPDASGGKGTTNFRGAEKIYQVFLVYLVSLQEPCGASIWMCEDKNRPVNENMALREIVKGFQIFGHLPWGEPG